VVLGLVGLAVVLRAGALGPPSLWVDDAWVALATKTHGLHELLLASQTAPGFSLLTKGWLALVGFSEINAQLLPFAFGILLPVVAYLAVRTRGVGRLGAGAGAFALVVSPILVTESTRVKQFTLDAVCSLVLLVLAWGLLDDIRSAKRWWLLSLAGIAALFLSSPSAVILAAGIGAGLVRLSREGRSELRRAFAPVATASVFTATWWWLVIRPVGNDALRQFWHDRFFVFDEGACKAIRRAHLIGSKFFQNAVPLPRYAGAALAVAAFVLVFRRSRFLGLLLTGPFFVAVVLATLRYAPLGTGRTDAYLYPAIAIAIAVAVDSLGTAATRTALVAGLVVLGAWTLVATARGDHAYPKEDVRSLVSKAERVVTPKDALLVYHDTNFAFALYTSWPIEFVSTPTQPMGYQAPVRRPNVFTLEPHESDPAVYATVIDEVSRSYDTLWLAASNTQYRTDFPALLQLLRQRGYRLDATFSWEGASLSRWSRR